VAGTGAGQSRTLSAIATNLDDIAEAAYWAYRERFLYEKGGKTEPIVLDVDIIDVHEDSDEDEAAIDVIDILKSEGVEVDGEDQLGTLEAPSCCGQLSAARPMRLSLCTSRSKPQ
jgi:hypothetical protein